MKVTPETLSHTLEQLHPFSRLPLSAFQELFTKSSVVEAEIGDILIRPDELPAAIFVVLQGVVRLLALDPARGETLTLAKRGPGEILGWVSILRAGSCEYVTASSPVQLLAIPSKLFVAMIRKHHEFSAGFYNLTSCHEAYCVIDLATRELPIKEAGWTKDPIAHCHQALATTILPGQPFKPPLHAALDYSWFLSTCDVPGFPVGFLILPGCELPVRTGFTLPYRLIGIPTKWPQHTSDVQSPSVPIGHRGPEPIQLDELGIVEPSADMEDGRLPIIKGRGLLQETMAVLEMVGLHMQVPFRRDVIQKTLEDQFRRDKGLSVQLLAGLCELLGLTTQIAELETRYVTSIEPPALCIIDSVPVVLYGNRGSQILVGHPQKGLMQISKSEMSELVGDRLRVALPKRLASTPTSRFGWNWFTPLVVKYRGSLSLVFVASLLAQLFGLGIPLLIQQIIDKVLSQGNLSSLNVLGTAMIVLALFQGILNTLRTYIFVDTTDRMDLALGSAVINRLLALPLSYFEKRPVGELSQRLGELSSIRNFLTGTALISILNLVFLSIYIVVMLLFSPFLSAVALSVFPLYFLIVVGTAPLFKRLIRKRAVEQARTQSHLIEILSGIQTVKAQHFELTARWKWQDRYRKYVEEGFKSSVVGVTSKEAGTFLNQLSGLLVLWIGMGLVIKGDLTLGMLIAFRIISGNVTGPLLQLSTLYQSVQNVQLSMERLSDVIDQNPESGELGESMLSQIALPPICGSLRFEHVMFRFKSSGPFQLDDVSLEVSAGQFVGIVGMSGSGKSTLMKLLPRLYQPESGRIFIDDYDISKVDLSSLRKQIGVVPQDSLLFEGTISENIALNDPLASDESIIAAAKLACAHDFIMSLERGYATLLSERGSNLSGGQRQRLAVARTILMNPMLLVMDEATSALDYETESILCRNLQAWASGRTVLFVTHRLSTIRSCDQIIVMHEGRIVESGTHERLMSLRGRYSVMLQQQEASA